MDPALRSVADAVRTAGVAPMVELEPAAARERVRMSARMCAPGPAVASVDTHAVDSDVSVRIYRPARSAVPGTIVHFHGGGWVTGDADYADAHCRELAVVAGVPVVSVDYRLAPEHPFPAALDDASAVMRWVAAGSEGLHPHVVVSGDSAGGNLATVWAHTGGVESGVRVLGQVLVYPVLDVDLTRDSYTANSGVFLGAREMKWFLDHYCPVPGVRTSPRVAPLRSKDLAGLPPTVLVLGGHDPLLDEGLEYAQRLRAAAVPVDVQFFPTLPHGFLQFTAVSEAARDAARAVAVATARLFDTAGAQRVSAEGAARA